MPFRIELFALFGAAIFLASTGCSRSAVPTAPRFQEHLALRTDQPEPGTSQEQIVAKFGEPTFTGVDKSGRELIMYRVDTRMGTVVMEDGSAAMLLPPDWFVQDSYEEELERAKAAYAEEQSSEDEDNQ